MSEQNFPSQAKVVIVGGGVMGAGLAYHLSMEGWTDCLLIEKGELTSGSTWHAAGQCPNFIADYNMAKIHNYGVSLYPKLEELTGQYVSWHGCGGIRFAYHPAEIEWFHRVAGIGKLIGYDCEIIDPEKIKSLVPYINIEGVIAGAWTLADGHVDPAGVCNAMAKGARMHGAQISTRNRVLNIYLRPSGEWEVLTENGTVIAEHVVNAAGCYAREISKMVGTDLPMINMKHTYLVTESVQEFFDNDHEMPVIRDPYPSSYYRQEQKSALIGIYETENSEECWSHRGGWPEWDSENELFDPEMDNIMPFIERVMERVPMWEQLGIKRVVCGAIPHTPDSNPYIGPAAGIKNFWHCNGASIGIASGAGCGKYLAQWMIYGDAEINMSGLDPRRFSEFAPGEYTKQKSHEDYEHMYKLHLPGEERPAGRRFRATPLYDKLKKKGAIYTEINGWERAKWFSLDGREEEIGFRHNNSFSVVSRECAAVRERVGIMELSTFAKYEVSGRDAEAMLNRISANSMPRLYGIALTHYLAENGRLNGESTITRLDDNFYYVLSGATSEERDLAILNQSVDKNENVHISNVTNEWGALLLAGPQSRKVLSTVTDEDLCNSSFPWLSGKIIDIQGRKVRALRVSYTGDLGWELHCKKSDLVDVYAAVFAAGEDFAIADFGSYTLNSLRMEKAYKGWGAEMTNEISMVEAGLMRFFRRDKEDFRGKQSTLDIERKGVSISLVYFEVEEGNNDVVGGEAVLVDGQTIGVTTSGGYGHITRKSLGFAYVDKKYSKPNSEFQVLLLGAPRKAKVLAEPVWDPKNLRPRA
ncbi:MAG: FAD-dependent oxidoreductase [Gammaproteobacteria bacterium]|nr:FAD-dependent oxidoreductase [Gammaproteobacteria bacterium]